MTCPASREHLCKTAIWRRKRGEFSGLFERSLARKLANQTYPQMYRFIKATDRHPLILVVVFKMWMKSCDFRFRDVFPPTGTVNVLSYRCSLLTQKAKLLSSKLLWWKNEPATTTSPGNSSFLTWRLEAYIMYRHQCQLFSGEVILPTIKYLIILLHITMTTTGFPRISTSCSWKTDRKSVV